MAGAHDYRRHGTTEASALRAPDGEDAWVRRRFLAAGTPAEVTSVMASLASVGLAGVVLAGALHGVLDRLPDLNDAVRDGLATTGGVS